MNPKENKYKGFNSIQLGILYQAMKIHSEETTYNDPNSDRESDSLYSELEQEILNRYEELDFFYEILHQGLTWSRQG